ncbi:MAG: membrane protein insertase YidC [Desulfobacterales bacterium]|nr:MAG: membrane protein insertase YidC [Desulfobacterales bacterium]
MEQTRLLLAIGLSFLVLFVWSNFFIEQPSIQESVETPQSNGKIASTEMVKSRQPVAGVEQKDLKKVEMVQTQGSPLREIIIDTPLYTTTLSTKGATFKSFVLKKYKETVSPDSPDKQLIPKEFLKFGSIKTTLNNNSIKGLAEAVYSSNATEDRIYLSGEKKSISFDWMTEDGTGLTKTYTFDPESYLIELNITVKNASNRNLSDRLILSLNKFVGEDSGYAFIGPSALINKSLEQIKTKKIEDKSEYSGEITWASVEDRYFISSVIPEEPIKGDIKISMTDRVVINSLMNPEFEIQAGTQKSFGFFLFMGPKSMELLDSLGHDMGKALNFGFFNIIAKPCLWFMNRIHGVIPNYGIAIILLTVFTKILLWPLGNKSYKSMSEMKKLQPLMTEIREKYKNDKQKMNQELMALYRTYKVNPMGGCLPMVLQIPVFFALYRMLYQAIELRHAPFFMWINDLSAPDRLFNFGFPIPFMEPPYGIPVLTIVMGATMLLQQKMSPPPGDPTQAKMMMLMPVVFTFIFINFSSGLVLYWLINNLLSISQQYYVQKKTL